MGFIRPSSWINPPTPKLYPRKLVIEGLIGAGKTHFSRDLANELQYHLLEEPVSSNKLLRLFYDNPARFAFAMQIKMLAVRLSLERAGSYMIQAGITKGVVMDRSLGGDTVFMELNTSIGNISLPEAEVYLELFEQMKIESPYPDIIVFLDVPLDLIRQRIKNRGRDFEQPLADPSNPYLAGLAEAYDRFLEAMSHHTCVVRLDWQEFRPASLIWSKIHAAYTDSHHSRYQKVLLKW